MMNWVQENQERKYFHGICACGRYRRCSGRHILGHLENGRLILEEVYRFENGMIKKNGHLCWDTARRFSEIGQHGICREAGKIPSSMGIDTWGVDYVLLDEKDTVLEPTATAIPARPMDEEVFGSPCRKQSFTPARESRSGRSTRSVS